MLTSNCVIVSLELCLDVGNDDYIILCHFDRRGGGGTPLFGHYGNAPLNKVWFSGS